MTPHAKIKQELAEAKAEYNAKCNDLPPAQERALSDKVRALNAQLVASLTKGAVPCPICGQAPHGMEQPNGPNRFEYEVGCIPCRPFVHTDGTVRNVMARGGMIPRHAVEAWNEGPDYWVLSKSQETNPEKREFKFPHPQALGPAPKASPRAGETTT